jgi:hypothetical protein
MILRQVRAFALAVTPQNLLPSIAVDFIIYLTLGVIGDGIEAQKALYI